MASVDAKELKVCLSPSFTFDEFQEASSTIAGIVVMERLDHITWEYKEDVQRVIGVEVKERSSNLTSPPHLVPEKAYETSKLFETGGCCISDGVPALTEIESDDHSCVGSGFKGRRPYSCGDRPLQPT